MKKIFGTAIGLLFLGVGCNPLLLQNNKMDNKDTNPLTQVTTIATTECGSDTVCLEKLINLCQPGTFGDSDHDQYIIKGSSDKGCTIVLISKDKTNTAKSLQCSVPSTIITYKDLSSYFITQSFDPSSQCEGSLKQAAKDSLTAIQDKLIQEEKQKIPSATTNQALTTAAARDKEREANIDAIVAALKATVITDNGYPKEINLILGSGNAACLNALGWQPKGCSDPFLANIPSDPLPDRHYIYRYDKNTGTYFIDVTFEGTVGGGITAATVDRNGMAYPRK